MRLELPPGLTLYFARHGQTQANVAKLFSGEKNTPLTATGREQAREVGMVLRRELGARPAIAFVASPLQRACTTMEIVREALDLPREGYAIDARLQEIDLGRWDQLTQDQARALDPAYFDKRAADKWDVPALGGENYAQVAARLTSRRAWFSGPGAATWTCWTAPAARFPIRDRWANNPLCRTIASATCFASPPLAKAMGRRSAAWSMAARPASP